MALGGGLIIVLGALIMGVLTFLADPDLARAAAGQVAAHALVGRETGIPVGLALGVPRVVVAGLAAMQDVAILLIGYALVVTIGQRATTIGWLDRIIHKPHPQRDAFAKRTQAGGVAALSLSLWIPFFPGGALVAALLARAAGYAPKFFLPALAASAVIADIMYVSVVGELTSRFGVWPVVIASLGIIGVVSGSAWLRRRVLSRRALARDAQSAPEPDAEERQDGGGKPKAAELRNDARE